LYLKLGAIKDGDAHTSDIAVTCIKPGDFNKLREEKSLFPKNGEPGFKGFVKAFFFIHELL
jgi:hypothetical protein